MMDEHEHTWKEEERSDDENLPWIVLRARLVACTLRHLTRTSSATTGGSELCREV